jgi:hypothetical protein
VDVGALCGLKRRSTFAGQVRRFAQRSEKGFVQAGRFDGPNALLVNGMRLNEIYSAIEKAKARGPGPRAFFQRR